MVDAARPATACSASTCPTASPTAMQQLRERVRSGALGGVYAVELRLPQRVRPRQALVLRPPALRGRLPDRPGRPPRRPRPVDARLPACRARQRPAARGRRPARRASRGRGLRDRARLDLETGARGQPRLLVAAAGGSRRGDRGGVLRHRAAARRCATWTGRSTTSRAESFTGTQPCLLSEPPDDVGRACRRRLGARGWRTASGSTRRRNGSCRWPRCWTTVCGRASTRRAKGDGDDQRPGAAAGPRPDDRRHRRRRLDVRAGAGARPRSVPHPHVTLATMGAPLSASSGASRRRRPGSRAGRERASGSSGWTSPWDDVERGGRVAARARGARAPGRRPPQRLRARRAALARAGAAWSAHSCVLSWWRAVQGDDAPAEWSRYRGSRARGARGRRAGRRPDASHAGRARRALRAAAAGAA